MWSRTWHQVKDRLSFQRRERILFTFVWVFVILFAGNYPGRCVQLCTEILQCAGFVWEPCFTAGHTSIQALDLKIRGDFSPVLHENPMMGNFSWKSHTLIQYVTAYYHRESIFSSPNCDCNLSSWDCLCPLPVSQAPKIIFWIVRRLAIQRKRKGRALECFILALSAASDKFSSLGFMLLF